MSQKPIARPLDLADDLRGPRAGRSDVSNSDALGERFRAERRATVQAALEGPGATSPELRQSLARGEPPSELAVLVEKIRRHAYRITDEDLDALRDRYTEDQLFEVIVAAVIGAAEERLRAAQRVLEEA